MQKISAGEDIMTQNDNLARTTTAYGNSNWAEEFVGAEGITKEPKSSADQDWTKEFMANKPADLSEEWTREFTGINFWDVVHNSI